MRAFTLNAKRPQQMRGGGDNPVESTVSLDNGTTVANLHPEKHTGSWESNWNKTKGWFETGAKIQEADPGFADGFPFKAALGAAATGAIAGAGMAGVGAVLGAIAGALIVTIGWLVDKIFGHRPSRWDNAGPGVHWWYTNYAPNNFLGWVDAQGESVGILSSIEASARALLVWHLQTNNKVLWWGHETVTSGRPDAAYAFHAMEGDSLYQGEARAKAYLQTFYDNLGIDWQATQALYDSEGPGSALMYKRRILFPADEAAPPLDSGQDGPDNGGATVAVVATALGLLAPMLKR